MNGRHCRFTAAELDRIREVYRRWQDATAERRRLQAELGLHQRDMWRFGTGLAGKKPKAA